MNSMTEQTYRTPEGFELYKPLMMPDVRDFADVLTFERPWDYATMNHRSGYAQAETPEEIELPGLERVVSRFCSVRNMGRRSSMMVTPTPRTLEILAGDQFSFFDRIGFEAIYHTGNERVLIVASANSIIASRWLAYVDPATVPGGSDDA